MLDKLYILDGVLWDGSVKPKPYCPKHKLEMDPYTLDEDPSDSTYDHLRCEECPEDYIISRDFGEEQTYVSRKLRSRDLKNIKVLNLDDEAIPLSEEKVKSKDGKYFVTALLTESKVGLRLVVYAGEKGAQGKTQIFVEPGIRRLAFDQKDIHPADVFVKLEATFNDGTSASIERGGES